MALQFFSQHFLARHLLFARQIFAAVELYCEAFERVGALEKLEGFLSHYGADYYGLPRNKRTITLEKKAWKVPMMYDFGGETVTPLRGGETVAWSIVEN